MLAEKDPYINEASETIFQLSAEDLIRKRCRDREEYYLDMRAYEREVTANKKTIEESMQIIKEKDAKLADNEKLIKALLDEIEMLKSNAGK